MLLDDFRALVEGLLQRVPPAYLDGVVAVEVSPKTVPHPVRGDVYTLGECIPLEWSGHGADLQSRVILYHGSFAALAHVGGGGGERRVRLAGRGLGDAQPRAPPPPGVAGQRGCPRSLRLGRRAELRAARWPGVRSGVLPVGGEDHERRL